MPVADTIPLVGSLLLGGPSYEPFFFIVQRFSWSFGPDMNQRSIEDISYDNKKFVKSALSVEEVL